MADQDVVIISDSPSPPPPPSSPPQLPADPDFADFDFDLYFQLPAQDPSPMPPVLRSDAGPGAQDGVLSNWETAVLNCFPDICPEFLKTQGPDHAGDPQRIITHLLDEQEKGHSYPKRSNLLKRKRPEEDEEKEENEEEEMRRKFERADPRLASKGREYVKLYTKAAKVLLKASFPQRYSDDIENILKENNYQLYTTYVALDKATWSPEEPPIRLKKFGVRVLHPQETFRNSVIEAEMDALAAFDAASATCRAKAQVREAKEAEEKRKELEEADNLERAKAEGTLADCGCCYEELPLNRMVHCNGETVHWFCLECARRNAETAVGFSKYHLGCMSVDGCDATFSVEQRKAFLDDKLTTALELIEQEAVLRMAEIENLATCPFCPYAAEYPPVEENKEFRCENPGCRLVSCRLCREETHIPQTCDEAAKERGQSARRTIEEAMSAALIRKCNKCGTPFIKENGCNKMTCTRGGCRNVQCYVCSRSCDYAHFDDATRGGKTGNCPLFDSVEKRHEDDVTAAEQEARKKIAEENPTVDADMLKIQFSEKVKLDDERRKAANASPPRHGVAAQMPGFIGGPNMLLANRALPAQPPPPYGDPLEQLVREARAYHQEQAAQRARLAQVQAAQQAQAQSAQQARAAQRAQPVQQAQPAPEGPAAGSPHALQPQAARQAGFDQLDGDLNFEPEAGFDPWNWFHGDVGPIEEQRQQQPGAVQAGTPSPGHPNPARPEVIDVMAARHSVMHRAVAAGSRRLAAARHLNLAPAPQLPAPFWRNPRPVPAHVPAHGQGPRVAQPGGQQTATRGSADQDPPPYSPPIPDFAIPYPQYPPGFLQFHQPPE